MPKSTVCKWYSCCPIKFYTEAGKIDPKWSQNYCLVGNQKCIRFQKEAKGEYHPNNMMPDGSLDDSL